MTIWRFELRQSFLSSLIWTVIVTGLALLFMGIYPTYQAGADEFLQVLQAYPKELLSAFNINPETIFSYLGFYAFVLPFVFIAGSIYATNLGISIMGREKNMQTSEFLLSKPISRTSVWFQKSAAIKTLLLGHNIVFIAAMVSLTVYFDSSQLNEPTFWLMTFALLILEFFFSSLGMLIAVVLKKLKSISSIAVGVALSFYVVFLLQALLENEELKFLTPFAYVDPQAIVETQRYDGIFIGFAIALSLISCGISYLLYTKQDVR
ncbi:MAG: ABC transporter permease subunit [Culicoidibacterales bacterium]